LPDPLPDKKKDVGPRLPQQWRFLIPYVVVGLLLLWVWQDMFSHLAVQTIPYSQFKEYLARGEVKSVTIRDNEIYGRIVKRAEPVKTAPASKTPPPGAKAPANAQPGKMPPAAAEKVEEEFPFLTKRIPGVDDRELVKELEAAKVEFRGEQPGLFSQVLLGWILPLGLMVLLWIFISRRLGAAGQAVMSFGKSRAKLVADKQTNVTFQDVAGCDEAKYELQEVVDFLKNPSRYEALGAKIPKGVLLVGPPGTGKTLLARAVAGEAKVPFFSLSGSDFVEMFVGVGASRVRDLFEQAKSQAPCIIFIDELDAIGRQRGVHVGAVNDEREQTLNQLLVEMDGFEANVGVILLAATNRPDVLDRALLRPGRFDRQVVIDAPDIDGRLAILKVHSRDKPLAGDVDLRRIAQGTPGFSGADLANAINEAALLAARRRAKEISQHDLEEAIEKVVAGPERKSRRLDDQERRRVAYHEVGHALVAAYSEHADEVHKISIVPRGRAALGYTLQLPEGEQLLMTRAELVDRIKGLLGGRAAEEVVFNEVSTGAENDLERATAMARQMVCIYGMSPRVGLVHVGHRPHPYLNGLTDGALQRDFSERTAQEVDEEVKKLLDEAYAAARSILVAHRDKLDLVSEELIKRETLDRQTFRKLIEDGAAPAIAEEAPASAPARTPASTTPSSG
jgi:cell division protease FtsH